ncbi:D-3-phosphoglycerate dehydrogenase [Quillaja saponaria]|uniref:D-3-phosphoglycerate dehydrogenase n=1 Tax=Quillaja saponaria TaxID=32244 RepID=A0AAD7M2T9_QUISA|nr:D-3-phosphoglycerate dehydrogenase [Quillaja saponaria]
MGTRYWDLAEYLLILASEDIVVWNPLTQDHNTIPFSLVEFPMNENEEEVQSCNHCGFGYDPVRDDFKAALDAFREEPPPKDSKLVQHETVTVTPHIVASNMEAQECVGIEIAEDVAGPLKGEPTTAVTHQWFMQRYFSKMGSSFGNIYSNMYIRCSDQMGSSWLQVLTELKPFVVLAEKLGRLAVQLVAGRSGVKTVKVSYGSARALDDLDTGFSSPDYQGSH